MDIKTFLTTYSKGTLHITDKVKYDVRDVIEKVYRLRHGQYENPYFPDGTKKLFYNLGFAISQTIYRNTDIDTKNINVRSLNGIGVKLLPLLKMVLQWYLKVTKLARNINEFRAELIDMGHVIEKVVNGKPYIVNPLNIIVPPHVDSIQDSGCVEATFLTWDQVMREKDNWEDKWDLIQEVHFNNQKIGEVYFTVYEQYTWGDPEGRDIEDPDYEDKKICIKYLDTGMQDTTQASSHNPNNWQTYEELERFECTDTILDTVTDEEITIFPFKEQQFIKIKGRYWGFGVFELLAGLLEDYNERMNLKRRLDRQSLTGILIHTLSSDPNKSSSLTQEFLNSVDAGAILDVESDEMLQRLNAGTIPDFIPMIDKLFEIMRLLLGVTAQGTGEELPASTPATVSAINQRNAQTSYDVIIEQQSIFWSEMFQDFLLKDVLKKLTKKKVIAISGDPSIINDLDKMYAENLLNAKIQEFQAVYGIPGVVVDGKQIYFDTRDPKAYEAQYMQVLDDMVAKLETQGDTRFTQITEDMIKNIDFALEFYVDDQSFDKRAMVAELMEFRQMPDLTLSRKKLDEAIVDLSSGMSAKRFQKSEQEKQEEIEQARAMAEAQAGMAANPVDGSGLQNPFQQEMQAAQGGPNPNPVA